eukprot:8081921-Ditylum_brightwellii.AAC.1
MHNKPLQSASTKTEYKQHKRDLDDQEKLLGSLFESAKQLQKLKHNFKNCHTQQGKLDITHHDPNGKRHKRSPH